jgi:Uma2 family endonuclease
MALVQELTIDDFERLPDALAKNHELVDGELVDVSGNTAGHNGLRDYLIELLGPVVRDGKLGKLISEQEYDFGGNAHGPDVSFFGIEKVPLLDPGRRVQLFVPDLAIEIVSQNDRFDSLVRKLVRYVEHGTKEAWLLSAENRQSLLYTASWTKAFRETDEFRSSLIPGFAIPFKDLFDNF